MNTAKYRQQSLAALRTGDETRILLCTDTGAFGIDISAVEQVVIAQTSKTFKTQTQRIGRIRGTGTAFVYFPAWMDLTKKSKEAVSNRRGVEQVLVDFANPSQDQCPRRTACSHWGEDFVQPPNCVSRYTGGPHANKGSQRPLDKKAGSQ